ncbi:retrovirus-related pol polyprotein from transposon TNT 1-94 [Tanacetum coccineum]
MKCVPKVRKENVNTSISPTIDNASRITNVLKLTNTLGSNLSNVPSSSTSLADYSTHPIHSNRSTFKTKTALSSKGQLNLLHMDLCGPMRIKSINGKKYILVIVDDYSRGTKFLNKTLHAYFKEEGIEYQTSTPRTPEQDGIVERRNRTLFEAVRTMLSASKLPLFFWAEAIATACYTQNRSLIIPRH